MIKKAADLAYTVRFIRLLTLDWKEWNAYKEGVIDENGKRIKGVELDNDKKRNSYTPFIRLAANIKRLLGNLPGGTTKLGSFAAALWLIKEKYGLKDSAIGKICEKCDVDVLDFLNENSEWFVLEDKQVSPGIYRVYNPKILNTTYEEFVRRKDQIRIADNCYPIGDVFGVDIYEAKHVNTNQPIYFTLSEIYK